MRIQRKAYWLYDQIKVEKPDWEPMFAMQSTINWIHALRMEIDGEYGTSIGEQLGHCDTYFTSHVRTRNNPAPLAQVFGTLFHSLTFAVSLTSLCEHEATGPWVFPSAIVMYYYATYNSVLSMLAALNDYRGENHSTTITAFNDLRGLLPHPLNMLANRVSGETYRARLSQYSDATSTDLSRSLNDSRESARGMLLAYLSGTAKWKADEVKDHLRYKKKIADFRSKANRELRDSFLPDEVNYMNCAFRYRGKANYRDSIFLPYGEKHSWLSVDYLESLRIVSCFTLACAVAFAKRRLGKKPLREFWDDVEANFRGKDTASPRELFWRELMAG